MYLSILLVLLAISLPTKILILVLIFAIIYVGGNMMAKNNFLIGRLGNNEVKFRIKGESVIGLAHNLQNSDLDSNYNKVGIGTADAFYVSESRRSTLIWKVWGAFWIGIPGITKVFSYTVPNKERALTCPGKKGNIFDSILDRAPYEISLKNVEIRGNLKVDIMINLSLEFQNAFRLLFGILPSGIWLERAYVILESVIVTEMAHHFTYTGLSNPERNDYPGIVPEAKLHHGHQNSLFIQAMEKASDIMAEELGIEITRRGNGELLVNWIGFEASDDPNTQIIITATQAEEIARLNANAKAEEARGVASYEKIIGEEMTANPNVRKKILTQEFAKSQVRVIRGKFTAEEGVVIDEDVTTD